MADIVLTFRGQEYRVPDSEAFRLGEQIEDIITIGDMPRLFKNPRYFMISRCFGVMLRFAGCVVSDREVHRDMMASVKSGGPGSGRVAALEALLAIGAVLMDGAPEPDGEAGDSPEKPVAS